jgi:hypothetical protein
MIIQCTARHIPAKEEAPFPVPATTHEGFPDVEQMGDYARMSNRIACRKRVSVVPGNDSWN